MFLSCGKQKECPTPEFDPPQIDCLGCVSWGPTNWIAFHYSPKRVIKGEEVRIEDSVGIWLIKPNGKSLTYLGPPTTPDNVPFGWSPPSWSPDGEWIVTNDMYGRIWMRGVVKDTLFQVTEGKGRYLPQFSPDGKKIAFCRTGPDSGGVWILNLDTKIEKRIFIFGDMPFWHPSGESLVIYGYVEGYNNPWISIIDTTGSYQRLIYLPERGCHDLRISNDGLKIIFSDGGWEPQIWSLKIDGTELKKLTTYGGRDGHFSPDGKKIVYVKFSLVRPCQEGNGELYIMNSDGSQNKRLTYLVHDP
mgnify:CR=1 FL=1